MMQITFAEIVERIKDIVSKEYGRRVFDKDVARELGISPNSLRVYKATNHIPYKNVIIFCISRGVSADWLLFDPDFHPRYIQKAQNH